MREDCHKIRKNWILDTSVFGAFYFHWLCSPPRLLKSSFLSPSSCLSFPFPHSLYPSLAAHLWKETPRGKKGDTELSQPQLHLFLTNHGEHCRGITPRKRDENQHGKRPGEFLILETILSLLKFVCLPSFILSLA